MNGLLRSGIALWSCALARAALAPAELVSLTEGTNFWEFQRPNAWDSVGPP